MQVNGAREDCLDQKERGEHQDGLESQDDPELELVKLSCLITCIKFYLKQSGHSSKYFQLNVSFVILLYTNRGGGCGQNALKLF